MPERYEYYLNGRVHGPVSEDQLLKMLNAGELGASLRLRRVGESTWRHVRAEGQEGTLSPLEIPSAPSQEGTPSPLEIPPATDQHNSGSDVKNHRHAAGFSKAKIGLLTEKAAQSSTAGADSLRTTEPVPRNAAAQPPRWYYMIHGHVVGPVPKERLGSRVENGLLRADMQVREGEEGEWRNISDVDFLQESLGRAPKAEDMPVGTKKSNPSRRRRMVFLGMAAAVVIFMLVVRYIQTHPADTRVQADMPVYSISFPGAYDAESSKNDPKGAWTIKGLEFEYTRLEYRSGDYLYLAWHARTADIKPEMDARQSHNELQLAILSSDPLDTGMKPDAMHISYDSISGREAVRAEVQVSARPPLYARQEVLWLSENEFIYIGQKGTQIDQSFFDSLKIKDQD